MDKRNPDKTVAEVEKELKEVFNLEQIIWLPQCSYDDEYSYYGPIPSYDNTFNSFRSASANGHIDEICRFVSQDTILMAYVSDEEALNNKLHALNKERLDKGFEAVKATKNFDGKPFKILKMPVPEPIYVDLYPNHRIVQVNTLALNLYGGGIHCHTRNIPAAK